MLFQVSALMILTFFYACYIGKMILQKKAGIQTDQMGKGKEGLTKWIEIIMKVATYLVVVVEVVSIVLDFTCFAGGIRIAGLILSSMGLILFVITVYTMKDSWRAGVSHSDKTKLVTSGIFQISRNPAFFGFDLVYIGMLCMFFNWFLFVVSVFAIMMFHIQIVKNEEPFLLETFGDDYITYKKTVNRYFGRHWK